MNQKLYATTRMQWSVEMKKLLVTLLFAIMMSQTALAAGTHYDMRVDGLACPFCAYGIEKKLNAINGVSNIKVDLDNGLVSVDMKDGASLGEEQMKQLFNDAGFTYRSMVKKPI